LKKVAFFYATFPRPTETFVRRELRALDQLGFRPNLFSIWQGDSVWEGRIVALFKLRKLLTLFFWIPYWFFLRPRECRDVLLCLWNNPCHSFQNWCETFLGLGFALVESHNFKAQDYRLLHAIWATMPATAVYTIGKLQGIEFSLGAHAYDVFRHGGDWLLIEKLHSSKFVRTSSLSTAKRLEMLGVDQKNIKLIRRSLHQTVPRSTLALTDDTKLSLLSVGRLVGKKGYFHTLRIAQLLKTKGVPFHLLIIGGGPLLPNLLAERNRLKLQNEVSFGGSLEEEAVKKQYFHNDVFLFTGIVDPCGDRDGIPNVVPEALAANMLVLASNRAGAPEAFNHAQSGYALDPEDYNSWVSILSNFWQNPESFSEMRRKARQVSKERFDSISNGSKLLKLYCD